MSTGERPTCKELIAFLDDYQDGTLPSAQRAAFEEHLRICPPCVQYLHGYRKAAELGKAALKSPCDEPAPDHLVRAILDARKK